MWQVSVTLLKLQELRPTDMPFYLFLNSHATAFSKPGLQTLDVQRSTSRVHFPLVECYHNSLLIEMGLARITSWGQRIAFLVAVERIEAD